VRFGLNFEVRHLGCRLRGLGDFNAVKRELGTRTPNGRDKMLQISDGECFDLWLPTQR